MVVAVSLNRRVDGVTVTRAGGLTGLSKPRLAEELGEARVQAWDMGCATDPRPCPPTTPSTCLETETSGPRVDA